jgi:putative oxidoreductase
MWMAGMRPAMTICHLGETHMNAAAPYLITLGRVMLSLIFIQSGIMKIFDYAGTQTHMVEHGLPGVLLPLVILVEAGGGLCVLAGFFTRWAALALGGFCVLAAIFFHYQPGDMMQMINFVKNITIAGGFLVLAGAGPGAWALDNRRG